MDYLPRYATIEQACNWLQAKTGQTWLLSRLLECCLKPYFWLEYDPAYPTIFGDRTEGYQARMSSHSDLQRLEFDGVEALVSLYTAHDGKLIKPVPPARVPLSELRFKREAVERVAEITNKTATACPAEPGPAPAYTANDSIKSYSDLAKYRAANSGARWDDGMRAVLAGEEALRQKALGAKGVRKGLASELGITPARVGQIIKQHKGSIRENPFKGLS